MTINVIDAPMGTGKTSAAINFINNSSNDKRFLYIAPILTEVERIKTECKRKNFFDPPIYGTKIKGIIELFKNESNIASTHQLFSMFTEETIELARIGSYTLIMDEVSEVVKQCEVTKKDLAVLLEKYFVIDEDGVVTWNDPEYRGKFDEYKRLCDLGCLMAYGSGEGRQILLWQFPITVFKAFKEVYIMSYMFDVQIQKYYYDLHDCKYNYLYVKNENADYIFTDEPVKYNFNPLPLINIIDHKINSIGEADFTLSRQWFLKHFDNSLMSKLKNDTLNYFKNIVKTPSSDNMWTSFQHVDSLKEDNLIKKALTGKGYAKGFVSCTTRATNEYRHKTCLAYLINRFMNPIVKNFFIQRGVDVDENMYALSEMIQWIWRSAIRDGKPINIYIPSKRMRDLLTEWLEILSNIQLKTETINEDETDDQSLNKPQLLSEEQIQDLIHGICQQRIINNSMTGGSIFSAILIRHNNYSFTG